MTRYQRQLFAKLPVFDPAWSDEIKMMWWAAVDQFIVWDKAVRGMCCDGDGI